VGWGRMHTHGSEVVDERDGVWVRCLCELDRL
jgi:hypothetical protein